MTKQQEHGSIPDNDLDDFLEQMEGQEQPKQTEVPVDKPQQD
jgi:hypothetical protein